MSANSIISILGQNEIECFGLKHILEQEGLVVERALAGDLPDDSHDWQDTPDHLLLLERPATVDTLDFCGAVRAALPHVRLAILCDACDVDFVRGAFSNGVDGVLLNQMSAEALVCAIRLIATGAKYVPPQILPLLGNSASALDVQFFGSPEDRPELSEREIQILQCLTAGDANKDIALRFSVSEATVKAYVKAILRKLRVDNRTQAAIWAISQNRSAEEDESSNPVVKH